MPVNLSQGNAQYSVLTTAGTYTLNPGPASPSTGFAFPGPAGAYYGIYVVAFGTSPVFTVYDIVPAHGTVAVATNILHNGTGTAVNQSFTPAGLSVGVRYQGALVIVTTGTANTLNALWD